MYRTGIIIFAAFFIIFSSSLVSYSAEEKPAKKIEADIKANGASFNECVSMAEDLAVKGDELSAKEEYGKAIEYYNMAISINGNFGKALLNRGIAYYNIGLKEVALVDINKSLAIDKDVATASYFQGVIYNEQGEADKALESFNKAIDLQPDHSRAFSNRGKAYVNKGLYERAIDDYNAALKKDPELIEAYTNRGNAYEYMGDYKLACRDWKKACDNEACEKFRFMEIIGACGKGNNS
ncbi:MAG: tetratricopeptide repeat protein [Thermodesulfobacteriota bacterium]